MKNALGAEVDIKLYAEARVKYSVGVTVSALLAVDQS